MEIKGILYDEASIHVVVKDPVVIYNPNTLEPTNVMTIQLSWSPEIRYSTDDLNLVSREDSEMMSNKIKQLCLGAVVKAVCDKLDEGIVRP